MRNLVNKIFGEGKPKSYYVFSILAVLGFVNLVSAYFLGGGSDIGIFSLIIYYIFLVFGMSISSSIASTVSIFLNSWFIWMIVAYVINKIHMKKEEKHLASTP